MNHSFRRLTSSRVIWAFCASIWFSFIIEPAYSSSHEIQPVANDGLLEAPTIVKVTVLAPRGKVEATKRWQPMIHWLDEQFPHHRFQLVTSSLDELEQAVRDHTSEFVITNPGQSVILGRQYPLSWIATLNAPWENGTSKALGSALIVRADSRFKNIEDLHNASAVAVAPNAFGGFLTLRQYFNSNLQDPNMFFQQIDYLGFPLDAMIYQVRDQITDVAITPVCVLESMATEGLIDLSKFRVINDIAPDFFPCAVSTHLYPNWSFAKTNKADEKLATAVAKTLLSLPPDSDIAKAANSQGWAAPISPLSIDKLYQDLDIHPLQTPWWQQALLWLKFNQEWAWGALILFLALNCYHFWLEYRFNHNQKLLNLAQNDLKQKGQMLEHAQRIAIVGGLGSNLAHEINQPLAAILNYNQGAKIKVKKGAQAEEFLPIFDKVEQQIVRVDGIVKRLRNLTTKRPVAKQHLDIKTILDDTLMLLRDDLTHHSIDVQVQIKGKPRLLFLDPVGIQQVLINLLNNSRDACLSYNAEPDNTIHITVDYQPQTVNIIIVDNGEGLRFPASKLRAEFFTTKEQGLGLGLSICHDIIDNHRGQLVLQSIQPHGCEARIQLFGDSANCEEK